MKDPCLRCVVQSCCTKICKPRLLYSAIIYEENAKKNNQILHEMWDKNRILIQSKSSEDYAERYMDKYIEIVKRKKQKNEETTGTPTGGEIPDAV